MKKTFALGLILLFSGGVKPYIAVNERADFTHIKRVAVVTFSGEGGDVAADLLTQDLLQHGADVVERSRLDSILQEQNLAQQNLLDPATVKKIGKILGVDAIFSGTITQNIARQNYLISNRRGGYSANTVTPVAGDVGTATSVIGAPGTEVVTSAAQAGLIARMVDVETGSILWSGRMSYEGWDTASTMAGITESFVKSLIPLWPTLNR